MRPLLLLRPEPGLSASAAKARAMGLEVIERPLFAIEAIEWDAPEPSLFDGLLLTSANAIARAGRGLEPYGRLPVHAIGARTAEAARAAGLGVASEGERGVDVLLASLPRPLRLLHLGGADRIEGAPGPHCITDVAVYRAAPIADPRLPPLGGLVIALHSPRAGARLAELAQSRSDSAIAAISEAAAAACGAGWESVEVAPSPNDSALLALAARLCQSWPA